MMETSWLEDGRKIPDEAMYFIRRMAVHAVRVRGESPELVARTYNFNRDCIYRWLRQYDAGGFEALKSRMASGAKPVVTAEMEEWLKHTILAETPDKFGYDTNLWTCPILAALLQKEFDVTVSDWSVAVHLKKLGLSCQKPEYQDVKRDEREVALFLNEKFPRIQRLAERLEADIGFEDESGVGVTPRHGRTWGMLGKTPIVKTSMQRGGYNVLSVVAAEGTMRYSVKGDTINGDRYIEFLKTLIRNRKRPLVLLVDHATFHGSKSVRDFVRAHRTKLRIFFLPKRTPEMNPTEQVWNEIKSNGIGKQPVKNKADLKKRLYSALRRLQKNAERVATFFHMPNTRYAMAT